MATSASLRSVFDRVTLESLSPLSLGLGCIFAAFVIADLLAGPPQPYSWTMIGSDIVSALAFFLLYGALELRLVPQRWANVVVFGCGMLAVFNTVLVHALSSDTFYLAYLPMIAVGYGAILLSIGWLLASLGAVLLSSLVAAAFSLTGATILHYSPAWFAAAVLAVVLLVVRRRCVEAAQSALQASQQEAAERHRLEARLSHAHRLESLGRLVSGVAHEFNNLMTPIIGYSGMALQRATDDDQLRFDLGEIHKAGESAATLTARLLAFSSRQALHPQLIDINEVVLSAKDRISRAANEHFELILELEPGAGHVLVDPIQMEQVLLDLAANAADAMPGGGQLRIQTAQVNIGHRDDQPGTSSSQAKNDDAILNDKKLQIQSRQRSIKVPACGKLCGPCVELCVKDTGIGMTAEVRERAFEPFFTTKEPGDGPGLGLAAVHGLIAQSGGTVEVASKPGKGTRVRVLLPRAEPCDRGQ